MRTLRQVLSDYEIVMLEAIAERNGIALESRQRDEAARQIEAALRDPELLGELIEWLPQEERAALDALLRAGGRMKSHRFLEQFGPIRPSGPGRMERETPWRTPASPAEALWYRGLIARAFATVEGGTAEFIFIPADLLPLLPLPQTEPDTSLPLTPLPAPRHLRLADTALADDLVTLMAFIHTETVPLGPSGAWPPDLRERVRAHFIAPDTHLPPDHPGSRWNLLTHMLHTLQLVQTRQNALHLNTTQARAWLKLPLLEQHTRLQQTWLNDTDWNDLWRTPGLRCEATGNWRNDPVLARRVLLDLLRRLPPDAWFAIDEFIALVRQIAPDFQRPDGDFESWYIRQEGADHYLMGKENWDAVEGRLIRYLLTGPLAWLGFIDLGEEHGTPHAFRLSPWGWTFWEQKPPTPPKAKPITLSPEGVIRVPRHTPPLDRFQIARISAWERAGDPYIYRLTPSSIAHCIRHGIDLPRLERFLHRITGGRPPAAALTLIRTWAQRVGQVRLRRGILLQVNDPSTLTALRRLPEIASLLGDPLSPTAVWVSEEHLPALRQALRRAGYPIDEETSTKLL